MSNSDAVYPAVFRLGLVFLIVMLGVLIGVFAPVLANSISLLIFLGIFGCFALFVIMFFFPTIGIYLLIISSVFLILKVIISKLFINNC